ncbi:MAG: NusG domain II-containing protein [Clostridia bacterium]|nr:NusG domain II-containing protein [Clostridia bacterium]
MKKRDIILISAVLASALLMFLVYSIASFLQNKTLEESGNAYVVIEVDGREIARYSLSEDGDYELNGGTNTLRIKDGEAYLIAATCPDGLCVGMGKAGAMKPIVCLPNKLTVTLYGEKSNIDLVN